MLAWALGLWPFKDCFWTTSEQLGNPRYIDEKTGQPCIESWPERQVLIAILSGGVVGPADKIGCTDKALLMRTCREDGLLLKPDKPATPIDRMFLLDTPPAKVWDTYSRKGNLTWHYVFVFDQAEAFELSSGELGLAGDYVAYHYETGGIERIPAGGSLHLKGKTEKPWDYWILAPVLANGMAMIGDTSKFVTAANRRIPAVRSKKKSLFIEVEGVPGTETTLTFISRKTPVEVKMNGVTLGQAEDGWIFIEETELLGVKVCFDKDGKSRLLLR